MPDVAFISFLGESICCGICKNCPLFSSNLPSKESLPTSSSVRPGLFPLKLDLILTTADSRAFWPLEGMSLGTPLRMSGSSP